MGAEAEDDENSSSSWASWFYKIADYVIQIVRNTIFNSVYPIGTIYTTVTEVNPSELFGGEWIPWGSGRVPVGVDRSIADFSTIERTGGEVSHTLTVDEMPSHTHNLIGGAVEGLTASAHGSFISGVWSSQGKDLITSAGGNVAHNNLPPYITCYMWKRVA